MDSLPQSKRCSKCRELKPLTEFFRAAKHPDGLRSDCKACCAVVQKAYNTEHAERLRQQRRASYVANHEVKLEQARLYRSLHPDQVRAATAKWRRENPERVKETARRTWRARNKLYYVRHKSKENARSRRYRATHPDYDQTWRQRNIEKVRDKCARRRALRKHATVETFSRIEIFERDGGRCHICKRKVNPQTWHLDHLVPLSLGGEHSRRNVAVACAKCNLIRNNRGPAQLRLE